MMFVEEMLGQSVGQMLKARIVGINDAATV